MRLAARLDRIENSDYHGIRNPGALCYLTSVLHVLCMTRGFPEAVGSESATHSDYLDQHLASLFQDLKKRTVEVDVITNALGITEEQIHQQRDAAECFQKILSRVSPEASQMFQGELERSIRCCACGTNNKMKELFWTLPLSVFPGSLQQSPYDLEMAFKDLFMLSTVTRNNQIYCNNCEAKEDATIECSWTHPPVILMLQLNGFSFDRRLQCYVKDTVRVDVPQKLHTQGCCYQLYAHVNHGGSLRGGHYTATVRSYETGCWYRFDDARVRLVNPQPFQEGQRITESSAYLLMYRKEMDPGEKRG